MESVEFRAAENKVDLSFRRVSPELRETFPGSQAWTLRMRILEESQPEAAAAAGGRAWSSSPWGSLSSREW